MFLCFACYILSLPLLKKLRMLYYIKNINTTLTLSKNMYEDLLGKGITRISPYSTASFTNWCSQETADAIPTKHFVLHT